ncbi:GNAT family N-acetyltransferase [Chamaesiphon polymorphus]|uniref:GNAT family N-acetyltransferase n=1 Tax=Chamaesiphon polymorphus CCALA 037 TaxID=2107692 RepID=A0A2T1GG06_9CYAN|nr:GNAT family N-acetyltransferase [Chamaesiphon polymorphus]PSB56523.1 GNAT family N-acetyltransferase [Chamaesiphon polymorphus CCALA 037]
MNDFDICQLDRSQITIAGEIAAKAFEDNPVFNYSLPEDPELRFQALTWLTSRAIDYCVQYKHVYTTSDLQGIAAWLPPGAFSSNPLQQLQMALQLQFYSLPLKVGWNRLGRLLNFLSVTEQAHHQDMGDLPHWYLWIMVVHPMFQGQGVGSRLLQPILQQASDEGLACYLITSTEQAVCFYQKNGFEIVRNQKIAPNAPPFWALKFDPCRNQRISYL